MEAQKMSYGLPWVLVAFFGFSLRATSSNEAEWLRKSRPAMVPHRRAEGGLICVDCW